MKKFYLLLIAIGFSCQTAIAQVPDIVWSDNFGGTSDDQARHVQQTYDSGFVVAGFTLSNNGDVHDNNGWYDYWIIKLNSNKDTTWTRALGGTSMEWAYSIQQTFDSGYVVAGFTQSNDGYVHGNHGNRDFWVVRLNPTGDTLWTRCFGGSLDDEAYTIQQTYDSGFVVAGYTKSNDGDVHGNHGLKDYWVIKLNAEGDTLWTNTLGGSSYDQANSIQQTFDSSYIVAGYARSTNGDVSGNHGLYDYWIVKLDANGSLVWSKTFGGSSNDYAQSVQQVFDSGFIIAGEASSTDGDVHGNHGNSDFWVVKITTVGDTVWTKSLGGSSTDIASSIQQIYDSSFIIAGYTRSINGDVHGNHGNNDYWIVRLKNNGDTIWTRAMGGSNYEKAYAVQETYDSTYIVAGYSRSNDGDVYGNNGFEDFWIVQLAESTCPASSAQTESNITTTTADLGWIENGHATAWQIILDTSGFDTAGATPVSVSNNPYTWSGLTENTNYDWYVRADCGWGSYSIWTGPHSFWTICNTFSAPFNEDFISDTLPDCWSKTGIPGWQFSTGAGDGAADAGDHTPGGGTNYAWVDAPWYPDPTLTTPFIDISSLTNPSLEFWYFCKRTNTMSENQLKVEFWDGAIWNILFNQLVNQQQWQYLLFDLSGYSISGDVQFRFTGVGDPMLPGNGDLLIDDVLVDEYPTCPPVFSLYESITEKQVHLGWSEIEGSTSWQIMLDTTGFDTATATPVNVSSKPYTLSDLTENTSYDWYVRSDCGGGDYSDWTGPKTFIFHSVPWLIMQNTFGGSSWDRANSIQQTFDSGFVVAGYAYSDDWDVSGNHGNYDFWVVRLNGSGDTLWTKSLGGSSSDQAYSIQQTFDSGYVVAGGALSNNGDVHGNHGNWDFWVVKLNEDGDTNWTRAYGGLYNQFAYSIQQTYDSGYIVAGSYNWTGGFPTQNDYWVIRLNSVGDTIWTKTLGGSNNDYAYSVLQTYDSNYVVAGYAFSNDGDVSGNHGFNDYWVVKLNSIGDTIWTKTYGGSSWDIAYSIQQTFDKGYVVAGYSYSTDGDVHDNHGDYDFWVVKLNTDGDTLWTKTLGGLLSETAFTIQQTSDSGYVVAGYSISNSGEVHGNKGGQDLWVVKLNSTGDTLWTKTAGGLFDDRAKSIQQIYDNAYVIAGTTESYDGDIFRNHGGTDFWVLELAQFPNHIYQSIPLISGWNIISFNVSPPDSNLLNIVQPLIDSSELVKVMDEAGGFIQNIPGIGWMNTIGNMANTEGYYTKVSATSSLTVKGEKVSLPYTIPLITGWNIMGYPLEQSQDAQSAVQPLIDSSELVKVMDEAGGFIQNIPGVGWMNTIGDFEAGEGYYIKVTANTSLTLDNPPVLFVGNPAPVQQRPVLFNIPEGNPYLPMNIIVTGINIDGYAVQSGDEVGVFDNNRLVGAGVITTENKVAACFAAAMDDPLTTEIDGYIEGNIPRFLFRSANLGGSIQLALKPVFGDKRFTPLGTLVCTLEGSLTGIEEEVENIFALKCIPNPASDYTNIQYQLPEEGLLTLEVFDLSSHRIGTLQNEQLLAGSHNYRFDAAMLEKGIYLIRIQLRTKDNRYTEVVKFVRN